MSKLRIYNFRLLGLPEGHTTESVVRIRLRADLNEAILATSPDGNAIQVHSTRMHVLVRELRLSDEWRGDITYTRWEDAVNKGSVDIAGRLVLVGDGVDNFSLSDPPMGMEAEAQCIRQYLTLEN
jgi:hypothetical protein